MTAHSGNTSAWHDGRILVATLGAAAVVLAGSGFGAWHMTLHGATKRTSVREAAVVRQVSERVPAAGSSAATSAQPAGRSSLLVVDAASAPVDVDRALQSMNGFLAFNGIAPLQGLTLPAASTVSSGEQARALQSMNAILAANGSGPVSAETVASLPADASAVVNQAVQSMNAFLAPNGVAPLAAVAISALTVAAR